MSTQTYKFLTLTALPMAMVVNTLAYEAHEWGTFTSLVGSNGITQHGMYHEDEVLPSFVHGFGELAPSPTPNPPGLVPSPRKPCRGKGCFFDEFYESNVISQKMETPVIYFYMNEAEKAAVLPKKVLVNVKFPQGLITDTFPAPVQSLPRPGANISPINGSANFDINILPQTSGGIPAVESGNIYGHARLTDSQIVESAGESEKFIFYRGLGQFQPKFQITSNTGDIKIGGTSTAVPSEAFLISVNDLGISAGYKVGSSLGKEGLHVSNEEISRLKLGADVNVPANRKISNQLQLRNSLIRSLTNAGLKTDEAVAMVNTWEHGYLKTPGLRLLYVLPRAEADEILPLAMIPQAEKLERVFVGRIEVLTDLEELELVAKIKSELNGLNVVALGRFAESKLRRAEQILTAKNGDNSEALQAVKNLIQKAARHDFLAGTSTH